MKIQDIEIKENVSLKNLNTYHLESTAKYLIEIKSINELKDTLKYLKEKNIDYFILGAGSNVILDEYFDGAIIRISGLNKVEIDGLLVKAEGGVMLPILANQVIQKGLSGLEWAINIPGTLGGSIVGNAGAYNSCIFDYLKTITLLDENLEVKEVDAKDILHSYRHTELKNRNCIVLGATFLLEEGNLEEMMEKVRDRRERRMASQPLEYPSAGSVFRNPEGDAAGRLIEAAGLKGKRIGGAEVSSKHANFIVNIGNATSQDIQNLIKLVHDEVLKQFQIDLVLEQEIIDWK